MPAHFRLSSYFLSFYFLLFGLSLAAPAVHAAPASASPVASPKFTPATLFDRRAISLHTLPNGVRCIVLSTRDIADRESGSGPNAGSGPNSGSGRSGVVAVQVWVRAGSRYENSANAGAAGVLEAACLRASRSYPASSGPEEGGPRAMLEGLGAQVGSETSRDATFFSATITSNYYPAALRVLSDAVLRPRLTDADIAATKDTAESQAVSRSANALSLAADMAYGVAFVKHPYKRPAGGSSQSIEALLPTHARAFYLSRYTGANISVIVVGDVDPTQAHALIAGAFAGARKTTLQPTIPPENAPVATRNIEVHRPIRAATIAVAWGAPAITTPNDVVAMDVLLSHWKEGTDAALRRPLLGRDATADEPDASGTSPQSGANPPTSPAPAPGGTPAPAAPDNSAEDEDGVALAYDVDFLTQRDPSLMVITLVTPPATRAAAVRTLLGQVAKVRRDGVSEADLNRAKAALRRQYLAQSETPTGAAGALGFYEMIATYDFAVGYLDRTSRVTTADVRRIAEKYLSPQKYVQVVIEPQMPSPKPPDNNSGVITAALPR